jgi:hypothetical protein
VWTFTLQLLVEALILQLLIGGMKMKIINPLRVFLGILFWLFYSLIARAENCTPNTFEGAFSGEVTLCQNWDAQDQQKFWFLSQGSQIIPYKWFLFLEQPDNSKLFVDGQHMDSFRYLPQKKTTLNPDGLPIGFTKDAAKNNPAYQRISQDWLGLSCAACHTGQVEFQGHKMLVDGAPTMADIESFMHTLAKAMQTTASDSQKFDRFAKNVLADNYANPGAKDKLKAQLEQMTQIRQAWNVMNAGDSPYGFARLDAIGAIFNTITTTALNIPGNRHSANAPVSYPFVWDTPHHDKVQWNGSVANKGAGALGRNVGEVLGVFGSLNLNTSPIIKTGHLSSADIPHLGELEALIWKLQSPQWPATLLPKIDEAKLVSGRKAFEQYCLSCHADIRRDDPNRRIQAVLTPLNELKTDPAMTANFSNNLYESGKLHHRSKIYIPSPQVFDKTGPGVEFLGNAVIGTIANNLIHDPVGTLKAINAGRTNTVEHLREVVGVNSAKETLNKIAEDIHLINPAPNQLVYKGRPLNGIWATAPYLHNGSVRTLRQLLLPAAQRQKTFQVGSREYNPNDAGFKDAGGFLFNTVLKGNSNAGHEYGAQDLADHPDKLNALLEYLKSL